MDDMTEDEIQEMYEWYLGEYGPEYFNPDNWD